MEEEYKIHEVIISDSKGNLFNYHSDYMNENFSYDKEVDQITEYVPTQVQVMLEDKLQNAIEVAQQLWQCLNKGYTYSEAKIHMRAFRDGQTTVKELVVKDKEDA